MAKAFILVEADFERLKEKIELHYRKRAEAAQQPWATSFMHDDPRGKSIYDQFKTTWYEICRWTSEVQK